MKKLNNFFKGMVIGAVDIIPGISGGTMALLLNIYPQIINELDLLGKVFLKNILKFKFKKAFSVNNWSFLLSVFGGILVTILALAQIISWGLSSYPDYIYSFFFGLILISALTLLPKKQITTREILFLILGAILALIISKSGTLNSPNNYLNIFLSGALAVCAMILPGISGAFILLVLGKYEFLLSLLKNPFIGKNLVLIIIFILGGILGLILFSYLLNFLLKKHYRATLLVLIGFMLGSLERLWPFDKNLFTGPNILAKINTSFFISLLLIILGLFLGFLLTRVNKK